MAWLGRPLREQTSGPERPPAWEEVIHATWNNERVLPWDHLEGPLPQSTLAAHRREALGR